MINPYGPKGSKQHAGIYLPADETHLIGMLSPGAKRYAEMADGRPAYQRHKYLIGLDLMTHHRLRLFVDIGGHCGLWGMQAENDFEYVLAFEPHPLHREIYPWNMRSDRYHVEHLALGAAPAQVVPVTRTEGSSGDTHVIAAAPGEQGVPMTTLDEYMAGCAFDEVADLIKIDTEGAELAICQGGIETIRQAHLVIIEQKGHEARTFGQPAGAAVDYLKGQGMVELRRPISGDYYLGWPR
jgi:FkbM family methyltransferase